MQLYLDKVTTENKSTCRFPAAQSDYIVEFQLTLRRAMESSSCALIAIVHLCLNFPVAEHEVGPAHDEGYRYAMCPLLRFKEEKRQLEESKRLDEPASNRFNGL
jgi:hypothetical protein